MAEGGGEELSVPGEEEERGASPGEIGKSKAGKKKKRGKKRGEPGAVAVAPTVEETGPVLPARTAVPVTSVPKVSSENLRELLHKLSVDERTKPHQFWDTQPVPKLEDKVEETGPLEPDKCEVRLEPYSLSDKFTWDELDLTDEAQIGELYSLLNENYVEDEDNMFRFDYSKRFLCWALQPPGWKKVWHCGIRVCSNRKLVGFISAVPAHTRIKDHEQLMVEINFLCVHKKLRSKRVAPVLIKEITRRVNREGIFQAIYTAGVLLPKPIAVCRYWHRSINPKKLVDVQFSSIHRNMTLQRMIRLYRLPDEAKTVGLRVMERSDVQVVFRLLNQYLNRFDLVPVLKTAAEVEWWLLPRDDIVTTYVVENLETDEVTDFFSFYHLPSTVVKHPIHRLLHVAYSFYNVAMVTPLKDLMQDALIIAKKMGFDVFNALDVMENKQFLEELKFGVGDGNLHYYLYNWRCPEIPPEKLGLVLQ
jgi:glycylpeptide N-tetradecanoyltransferase